MGALTDTAVPVFLHHIDSDLKRDHNTEHIHADDIPCFQQWTITISRLFSIQAIRANSSNLSAIQASLYTQIPFTFVPRTLLL
jgi:hypothetical protein